MQIIDQVRDGAKAVLADFNNELMTNPKFASALGKTMVKAMEYKQAMDKNVRFFLNTLNLPAKSDYEHLLHKVDTLNRTIGTLELRIDELVKKSESMADKTENADTGTK